MRWRLTIWRRVNGALTKLLSAEVSTWSELEGLLETTGADEWDVCVVNRVKPDERKERQSIDMTVLH